MKEGNGFRFDNRIEVPDPPEGKVVVKFFGEPVFVSARQNGDQLVGNSQITEVQLAELSEIFKVRGISNLVDQKQRIAKGGKL